MNLLDRAKRLKSFLKPGLIILIPVFLGCDSLEDIGTEFDLNSNVDVNLIEINLPSTNLYIDSLRTDGEEQVSVGTFNDPLTGKVTAESYLQFQFQRGLMPGDSLDFDSIQLVMAASNILPILGTSNLEIDVFEISDTLINSIVYLATKQESKTRQVGNFTGTVRSTDEEVAIRLDDSYGLEIYDFLNEFPDSVNTHFFKGLALSSGASNESLLLLNTAADTSRLRIYMTGDTTHFAEFNFQPNMHTYIERDRSSSPFSAIVEDETFDLPDGRTVIDPTAGITTVFNIDGLKTFFDENPDILINTTLIDMEVDGFADRDTLQGFNLFFRQEDGGIFGPAIIQDPFANIVMTDQGYLNTTNLPAPVLFNDETEQYLVRPTLFFQSLYNNYQNFGELAYVEPFQRDTVLISDIVLISPREMTLQQALFNDSGINLRIFYTDVN